MIISPQIPIAHLPLSLQGSVNFRYCIQEAVRLSGQLPDLISLVIVLMTALRISPVSSCDFSSRWRKLIMEKTNCFLLSAVPTKTAREALQH